MLALWLSVLPTFLLLPKHGLTDPGILEDDSGLENLTVYYNMDDRLVPSKYQDSYPLFGLRCFPRGVRLPCDCNEQYNCPCCYDYADDDNNNYTCYAPTYYEWSMWAPCEEYNEICDNTYECRIKYDEVSFRSAMMNRPVHRRRREISEPDSITHYNKGCQVQRAQCRPKRNGEWGDWREGDCSSSCMVGVKQRSRDCLDTVTNETLDADLCEGGQPASTETMDCNTNACMELSFWEDVGLCFNYSEFCLINQTRTCVYPENFTLSDDCAMQMGECPYDCSLIGMSDYSFGSWYDCNSTCFPGYERRDGHCVYVINGESSTECNPLTITEYQKCNTSFCDDYSEWENGDCDVECGGGYQNSTRFCNVQKIVPDEDCVFEMLPCNDQDCTQSLDLTIVTGDDPDAGTSATISVQLIGDVANITLYFNSTAFPGEFFPNNTFVHSVDIPDIGNLVSVVIGHDDSGSNPSWLLEGVVVVLDDETSNLPCGTWFDSAIGDQMTTRELMPDEQCHQENFIYDWSEWGPCSETCMPGIQTRNGSCIDNATQEMSDKCVFGPIVAEDRPCNESLCSNYSDWTIVDECSVTCGNGTQNQQRMCMVVGTVPLSCGAIQVDCINPVCVEAGPWGNYSDCSETCTEGTMSRSRECFLENTTIPASGCTENLTETVACNVGLCDMYTSFVAEDETACRADRVLDNCTTRMYELKRNCTGNGTVPDGCLISENICGPNAPLGAVNLSDVFFTLTNDHNLAQESLDSCNSDSTTISQNEILNDVKDFLYRFICSYNTFGNVNISRVAVSTDTDGNSVTGVVKTFDDTDLFTEIEGIGRLCEPISYLDMAKQYGALTKRDGALKAFIIILSYRTTEELDSEKTMFDLVFTMTTFLGDAEFAVIAAFNTSGEEHYNKLNQFVCHDSALMGRCPQYLGTVWDDEALIIQRLVALWP